MTSGPILGIFSKAVSILEVNDCIVGGFHQFPRDTVSQFNDFHWCSSYFLFSPRVSVGSGALHVGREQWQVSASCSSDSLRSLPMKICPICANLFLCMALSSMANDTLAVQGFGSVGTCCRLEASAVISSISPSGTYRSRI